MRYLNTFQLDGYLSLLEIITNNYENILIFDNFGVPYFEGKLNIDILKNSFLKCFLASKRKKTEFFISICFYIITPIENIVNKAIRDVLNLIN